MKLYDIPGSSATQTFLLFMDRFFDMLNVRSTGEHIHTKNFCPYPQFNGMPLCKLTCACCIVHANGGSVVFDPL